MKYATLWLLTLPLSPCNLYVLFTSHFRFIYYGLSWRHRIFHLPRSQCCVQRMYVYMYVVCKVYICVHTTPRHMPQNNWTLPGMVRSIDIIFPENTEQYVMLCCRWCQKVKFSRPCSPEGNGRTANPLDVHTATIINSRSCQLRIDYLMKDE